MTIKKTTTTLQTAWANNLTMKLTLVPMSVSNQVSAYVKDGMLYLEEETDEIEEQSK